MPNLLNKLASTFRANNNTQQNKDKTNVVTTPITAQNDHSQAVMQFPIWQITIPLCIVLIFGIGALTAHSMVEGRYLFDVDISRERIKVTTDIDKRESSPADDKTKEEETEELS